MIIIHGSGACALSFAGQASAATRVIKHGCARLEHITAEANHRVGGGHSEGPIDGGVPVAHGGGLPPSPSSADGANGTDASAASLPRAHEWSFDNCYWRCVLCFAFVRSDEGKSKRSDRCPGFNANLQMAMRPNLGHQIWALPDGAQVLVACFACGKYGGAHQLRLLLQPCRAATDEGGKVLNQRGTQHMRCFRRRTHPHAGRDIGEPFSLVEEQARLAGAEASENVPETTAELQQQGPGDDSLPADQQDVPAAGPLCRMPSSETNAPDRPRRARLPFCCPPP